MSRRVLNAPVGVKTREVERVLAVLKREGLNRERAFEARVDRISQRFLGRNYAASPLGGGPESEESFRVSFHEFDCVTYVETVLALACSTTPRGFYRELRDLRYQNGRVDWFNRNHFMTGWLRSNVARGVITDLTRGHDSLSKMRTLKGVAGLKPRKVTFRFFPKRRFARVRSRIRTGDVMIFVSTKKHLDVFHMGIVICADGQVLLRHATRSVGKVIEQDLVEFLNSNRMPGFILARPRCQR